MKPLIVEFPSDNVTSSILDLNVLNAPFLNTYNLCSSGDVKTPYKITVWNNQLWFEHMEICFRLMWINFVTTLSNGNSMDSTNIRPHVTSSNYIVLYQIGLRFHNKATLSECERRNDVRNFNLGHLGI
jgi:hypothetical protein